MTETLTLNEVAETLDVHYMTAYRYVRTGRLIATKEGGEWSVSAADLQQFVDGVQVQPRADVLPTQLVDRLVAGDENGAFQLLESAMASGAGHDEVYLDLFAPAMAVIGQRWAEEDLTIAEEHVASAAALRVVARLGSRIAHRGRTRGTILLATVVGDNHILPTAIVRDLLRARGFAAVDLGANTPTDSIVEMSRVIGKDLLAIGLSATTSGSEDVVRNTITKLLEHAAIPIVVGGGAFSSGDEIRALGDCYPSCSAREALDIFETIHKTVRAG